MCTSRTKPNSKKQGLTARLPRAKFSLTPSTPLSPESDISSIPASITTPPVSTPNANVTITNLRTIHKPFKLTRWKQGGTKKFKNLKQILTAERENGIGAGIGVATYTSIEAPPSLIPQKKYCDITGLEAKYTDPKTGLRYHSAEIYAYIRRLGVSYVQSYLGARGAAVVLR